MHFFGVLTFLLVLGLTPMLRSYAIRKNRLDTPSARKVHKKPTPRIGGHVFVPVAILAWTLYSLWITVKLNGQPEYIYSILASTSILFTIGIVDDFQDLSHRIKLPFQFIASGIVIYYWDLVPLDMGGVFGIQTISGWWGWLLMLFFFQFTINGLNYTDGINGLLGGYTLIVFGFLTFWAYSMKSVFVYPLLYFFCSGILAFLIYNFRKEAKTFMGDGGSTMIGLIASVVTASLIKTNPEIKLQLGQVEQIIPSFYVFALIFWYPLFDSLQVYFRRLLRFQSPFHADKKHFHHLLLESTNQNHVISTLFVLIPTTVLCFCLLISLELI